ncbi:hypothetical protein Tco_0174823 [Tanacetum coccineum]
MQKESVSKQGRKSAKAEPSVPKDPVFDDLDGLDYMETKAYTKDGVSTDRHKVSTEATVNTDKQKVSTDRHGVSTVSTKFSTDKNKEGTAKARGGQRTTLTTPTPTSTTFGDDETIAQVLITMSQNKEKLKEKEKGVELRDVEESERPRSTSTRSVLILKPLPKIDPKDKGKKRIEEDDESGTESDEVTTAEKKFQQLATDEELARKTQEDWEAEEEKKRLADEEAKNAALIHDFDDINARIEADRLLALRLQQEEREQFTIEERAKFLYDTIEAQRKFLAQQRVAAIRSKPPTKTQLRNQMMIYLKHVGNKKHSDLKNKTFEEIQALYERVKRHNDKFLVAGSTEDERKCKDINDKAKYPKHKTYKRRVAKEITKSKDIVNVLAKVDMTEQDTKKRKGGHIKMIARKRPRPQQVDEDDYKLKLSLIIAPDEDKEVDYEILDRKYLIIEWKSEYITTKPQHDESKGLEEVNLNVVIRSNGQRRHFSTFMRVLSVFDREDLDAIYQLVMNRYLNDIPKGFDRILWGDLMIMFNQSDADEFWSTQQDWKVVCWKLHNSSGVHTLLTETGLVIHMLVKNKYPMKKDVMSQMLEIKLESEEDSTMALELIRFVKRQITELEPDNSYIDEKDLKRSNSLEKFVSMEAHEKVKRQGVQLEQELSKKQKFEDVPEEKIVEPMKKGGTRKKQIARKGRHIDKYAKDEAEKEKEEYMKDKVKGASSESEEGIDAIPTDIKPPSIIDWKIIP